MKGIFVITNCRNAPRELPQQDRLQMAECR